MSARYELLHLIGSDDDETNATVDAYRAEELQAAADWLMSQGHTIAARALDEYAGGGAA
ncbi:hypothetical protein ACWENA_08495 [Streptomyces sp. NPDC004779]